MRRPVEGRQVALWFAALTAGLTWGIALRQAEALADLPWIVPAGVLATGIALLGGFVSMRIVTRSFELRTSGVTVLLALAGAIAAAAIVPGAPPPVETGGTLSAARLDGQSYSVDATCHWDRGMRHVVRLTARLPAEIGSLSGQTLVIDFAGGHVSTSGSGQSATLASGPGALDAPRGAVRPPDDSSGRLVLDGRHGGTVTGSLAWTCFPAAPNFGHAPPATGRAAPRPFVSSW